VVEGVVAGDGEGGDDVAVLEYCGGEGWFRAVVLVAG
jgi:hypothetical protein